MIANQDPTLKMRFGDDVPCKLHLGNRTVELQTWQSVAACSGCASGRHGDPCSSPAGAEASTLGTDDALHQTTTGAMGSDALCPSGPSSRLAQLDGPRGERDQRTPLNPGLNSIPLTSPKPLRWPQVEVAGQHTCLIPTGWRNSCQAGFAPTRKAPPLHSTGRTSARRPSETPAS